MIGYLKDVKIQGVAATVPKDYLDNEKYAESIGEKRIKRQIKLTGIKHRHVVKDGQRTSDLVSVAGERLIEHLSWKKDEISVLVFVTQSPDIKAPSTAMLIQKKMGLGKDCIAFDVNLGCSGFTSGAIIVAGLLRNTRGKGLILMGDCQHYRKGEEFLSDALLFGDGGAAIAMEFVPDSNLVYAQKTDGTRYDSLYSPLEGGRKMDGNAILLFSLNEVSESIAELMGSSYMENIIPDYYVLHQAQKVIMDGVASNADLPREQFLFSYEEYGNTSSASIPLTLCANIDKIRKEKEKTITVYSCGYGIGLAWSSLVFQVDIDNILSIIESDKVYEL